MQTLSYKKLTQFQTPSTQSKLTNQQRFWKKYQNQAFHSNINTISCISSNGNAKNLLLLGQGRNIKIIDTHKKQTIRQINTFFQNVSAIAVRKDGNVFAAADEAGRIQVMDVKEKFHLRRFYQHKKRINALQFEANDLYSAGDDFFIRHYDVAAGMVVHSYDHAHDDYIKSIKALQNNHILSGSYDGLVKLFDFRVHEKAQMQFVHGQQVQSMDLYPSKLSFIVGGGPKVSIFDIRSGKPLIQLKSNKKTVTCVKLASQGSRYITSSLDNYLKIFKSDTFQLTYQQKLQTGILNFDITNNNQCLGLGLQGGKTILKARKSNKDDQTDQEEKEVQDQIAQWMQKNREQKFAYNDQYFYRGVYSTPTTFDVKFQRFQAKKLGNLDNYLKKFQYKKGLLQCIQKKNMSVFLSLIDQLIQRGCLTRTLTSLQSPQLSQIIQFLSPLIHNQKYSHISNYVLLKIVQVHQSNVNLSEQVFGLKNHIDGELASLQMFGKLDGMLDMVQGFFGQHQQLNQQ